MGYSPLDDGLPFSTVNLFGGPLVLAVWALILADKDREGITKLNPDAVYRQWLESREPRRLEEVQAAWEYLASPDAKSKSQDSGGRRIVPTDDGRWRVVNAEKYRERYSAERRRRQLADAQRRHRAKKAGTEGAAGAEVGPAAGYAVESPGGGSPSSDDNSRRASGSAGHDAPLPAPPAAPSLPTEYVRIVAERGLEITGQLQLSTVEYALILGWRERGIPLRVVLSALNGGYEPAPGVKREPRSLRYFEPIVAEEWQRVQKGNTV